MAAQRGTGFQAFSQVAQTVTLINRFRTKALGHRGFSDTIDPVMRVSAHGAQYWSILEEENSRFLEELGYYDNNISAEARSAVSYSKRSGKKAWTAVRTTDLAKILRLSDSATRHNLTTETPSKAESDNRNVEFRVADFSDKRDFTGIRSDTEFALPTTCPRFTSHASGIPLRFFAQTSAHIMSLSNDPGINVGCYASSLGQCVASTELNNNEPPDCSGLEVCRSHETLNPALVNKFPASQAIKLLDGSFQRESVSLQVLDKHDLNQFSFLTAKKNNTVSNHVLGINDAAGISSGLHSVLQTSDRFDTRTIGSKSDQSHLDCKEEADVFEVNRPIFMRLIVVSYAHFQHS